MTPETKHCIEQFRQGLIPPEYTKTKQGILPAGWSVRTIGECLQRVEHPVDVLPEEMYTQIGIRSHGKGLFYKEAVTGKSLGNKSVFWVEPYCFVLNIVFAWEQAIGKTTQNEVGMIGSHRFPMYRPLDDIVDVDYLIAYFMTKRGKDILEAASPGGAGRNRTLGQDRFMKSKIILPPLAEQRRIAEILAAQDRVIELKEKLLAEKQRQKMQVAHRLFADASNYTCLSDVSMVTMGQSPTSSTYNTMHVGLPLIQGNADIEERVPCPRMYTSAPSKTCKADDILLSVRAPVGTVARSNMEACIGRGICAISSSHLQDYLYEYLLFFENKWGRVSQGSTFESISGDDISRLKIPLVENPEKVSRVLMTAEQGIFLLRKQLKYLKHQKKALMQLLLTGIVRVKNA